jgi:hypothetical protein
MASCPRKALVPLEKRCIAGASSGSRRLRNTFMKGFRNFQDWCRADFDRMTQCSSDMSPDDGAAQVVSMPAPTGVTGMSLSHLYFQKRTSS